MAETKNYEDEISKVRTRSSRLRFCDSTTSEDTILTGREKFRIEVFLPIIDSLITEITKRGEIYSKIFGLFGFISDIWTLSDNIIAEKCKKVANFYQEDSDSLLLTEEFLGKSLLLTKGMV